ncbi:MAG TPA: cytochrome c-type biogenesis protein CcmH [Acidimicrobiales bacterium]|nr:cytochrome c-type biogenesis protein CcmH [Acidimicrobiales bacterium]
MQQAQSAKRHRWALSLLWAAVAVAVATGLLVGTGALGGGKERSPSSLYERTLQVAGEYRCPVCEGQTAAASEAPEAVEIRDLVGGWLSEGRSQAQIKSYLVERYGPSILERPPSSGEGLWLWWVPVVVILLAAGGLGVALHRWRKGPASAAATTRFGPERSAEPATAPATRAQSMALPGVGARVALGKAAVPRYQRVAFGVGLAFIVLAGALWFVDRASGGRVAGGTVSGGPTGIGAELEQAASETSTDPAAALALYDRVLANDPTEAVALTGEGWIYAQAGFAAKGDALLAEAEKDDPSFALAHLYRGFVLLGYERDPQGAANEFKWYLTHGPDASLEAKARAALAIAEAEAGR